MKGALFASAAALALMIGSTAQAHLDISGNYDASYAWFDAPNTTDPGDARVRIVFSGRDGAAALTPNQYWLYAESYRRNLARLSMHRPVRQAEAHARQHAFRDVVASFPNLVVESIDLKRTYGDALITPDW
ncbi:hypothetical protein SAMN05444004_10865 [Jannaschia faecimaris]|uniref:Uncharacterized protein n=1 Tax=Jannaschia faecimaris TaxID=1244108 RepID=A0A1H3RCY4_9RHOB|nr:hypothetical protein [Jannaschia faecimaris]SDZ23527.1 hypothetical protein SAMN05444004_10865 [Jannaschia faecimaris]